MFNVRLNTIERVKAFSNTVSKYKLRGVLKASDGVFTVDGKSIMGLFSLDLTKDILLLYEEKDNEDKQYFLNFIKEFNQNEK